jgi:ribonuclease HII
MMMMYIAIRGSVITLDIICVSNHYFVICGVDEAGKGAVLGPMVVAGVACGDPSACEGRGWRDSKQLSPRKREGCYGDIVATCRVAVVTIPAGEIDAMREAAGMNDIVARAHARVITELGAVARHRADATYPIVAAASIVAKVTRDRAIANLTEEYGAVGSGYPSDAVTIGFLRAYISDHGEPPACARKSWKTVAALMDARLQTNLSDF